MRARAGLSLLPALVLSACLSPPADGPGAARGIDLFRVTVVDALERDLETDVDDDAVVVDDAGPVADDDDEDAPVPARLIAARPWLVRVYVDPRAAELEGLTHELSDIFRHAQAVFLSRDPRRARALIDAKRRFRAHTLESQRRHAIRLSSGVKSSVSTSRIHLDLLRELRRINSHLTAVAYPLLERA